MPAKGTGVTSARKLRDRCTVKRTPGNDCWIWNGATKVGSPAIWMFHPDLGKWQTVSGPRAAAIFGGKTGRRTWMSCANQLCVNPAHSMAGSYKDWGQWMVAQGLWVDSPIRVAASTAAARRQRGSITMDIAREIRAGVLTSRAALEQHGVKRYTYSRVKLGQAWKEPSHWAGLGAR